MRMTKRRKAWLYDAMDETEPSDGDRTVSDSEEEPAHESIFGRPNVVDEASPESTPSDNFRFLDLPGEIRNKIYELALCADGFIYIRDIDFKPATHACQELKEYQHVTLSASTGTFRDVDDFLDPTFSVTPSLVFANKAVHAESIPILYAKNKFSFQSVLTCAAFLDRIATSRQYLEEIKIVALPGCNGLFPQAGTHFQLIGGLLLDAMSLRHLHLEFQIHALCSEHRDRCPFAGHEQNTAPRDMLQQIARCVVSIVPHLLSANITDKRQSFLTVHPSNFWHECSEGCWHCDCQCFPLSAFNDWRKEECDFEFETAHKQLHGEIAKLLKAHKPHPLCKSRRWE